MASPTKYFIINQNRHQPTVYSCKFLFFLCDGCFLVFCFIYRKYICCWIFILDHSTIFNYFKKINYLKKCFRKVHFGWLFGSWCLPSKILKENILMLYIIKYSCPKKIKNWMLNKIKININYYKICECQEILISNVYLFIYCFKMNLEVMTFLVYKLLL